MAKKSVKEIIEGSERPHIETTAIKFPGKEVVLDVSEAGISTKASTMFDYRRIRELWKKAGKKKYGLIHTHPDASSYINPEPLPSDKDIINFLGDDNQKQLIIYSRDNSSGEVWGELVVRKTKETPKMHESPLNDYGLFSVFTMSPSCSWKRHEMREWIRGKYDSDDPTKYHLERVAAKYHLKYRWLKFKRRPSKEERKAMQAQEEQASLERRVSAIIGIAGICSSLFFLSSSLTGNAVSSLNQAHSNWIGGVLFVIGIIGAFAYFKRK